MARWLTAILVLVIVAAGAWVVFVNVEPVTLLLLPQQRTTVPVGMALVAAFALGIAIVGAIASVGATRRGIRAWARRRRARRAAREQAATARARELVWTGRTEEARTQLLRRGEPADIERLELLAEAFLQDDDAEGARALLEGATESLSTSPRLLALLAEACERLGDLGAAADALARARALQPESPRLARRLRDVWIRDARWGEALALQGEILLGVRGADTLAAEDRVLRALRYEVAMVDPDARQAARLLRALAGEDRTFVPAIVAAGDRWTALGRAATARRIWTRGVLHRPSGVLLDRLEATTKSERMTRLYRTLVGRHPDVRWLPLRQARFLLGLDRIDDALALLAELPEPTASHRGALAVAAEAHRRRGDVERSIELFRRAAGAAGAARCTSCGRPADAWLPRCPGCHAWNTVVTDDETV